MEIKLKKYDAYKNSGVEWLGEIPEGWEVKKLKNIVNFINRGATPDYVEDSNFKVINQATFSKGVFDFDNSKSTSEKSVIKSLERSRVYENDILLASTGGGVLGKVFYIDFTVRDYFADSHVTIIRNTKNKNNTKFYHYFFLINYNLINSILAQGSTNQTELQRNWLCDLTLPLPPLKEQTAIAKFLDDKTAKIDQAISIKEKQIGLLKERRQILIHKAVTQGIDPNVKLKDSGVEWIGEIPEHWEVKALKYSTNIFRGKFTHRPRNDERLYDGRYPFFQTGDIARAGKFLSIYRQSLNDFGLRVSTLFPKGTIVMTIAANIGDISILNINACFPDSIVGFKPMNYLSRDFLYNSLLIMKEQFMSSTIKNTQMNLNVDRIGTNSIVIPPKEEQRQIIEYIEVLDNKTTTAIYLKEKEIEKLKEYKASLINSVVTGKVRVS